MRKHLLLLSILILTQKMLCGFTPTEAPTQSPPQALQDPKTKVIYYLESDRRHVSAISPDGKLLWCCEVIPVERKKWAWIINIGYCPPGQFDAVPGVNEDSLDVAVAVGGQTWGRINKKTGVLKMSGIVQ